MLAQPAVWVNPVDSSTWTFVATRYSLTGLKLTFDLGGSPSLQTMWRIQPAGSSNSVSGGTSPVVANNVVYCVWGSLIVGVDPTTGNLLWQSTAIGDIHWQSPLVFNGTVYIADEDGNLTAFGLPAAQPRPLAGAQRTVTAWTVHRTSLTSAVQPPVHVRLQ